MLSIRELLEAVVAAETVAVESYLTAVLFLRK